MNTSLILRVAVLTVSAIVAAFQIGSTQRAAKPNSSLWATLDLPSHIAESLSEPQSKPTPDPREDITPTIKAKNVKVEHFKPIETTTLRPIGVVAPKRIVKTGRVSQQIEKTENHKVSDAFKKKMEIKEAKKLKQHEKLKAKAELQSDSETDAPKAAFDINIGAGNPPDNTVAVSSTGFIVAADNNQIGFYREDGTTLDEFSYPDFLDELERSIGESTSDPKVIYDPEENRFVFFIQSSDNRAGQDCVMAFSTSDDPTADWNVYAFDPPSSSGLWFDYPSLSVNYHEVFLTGNLYDNDDVFAGNIIFGLDKDDGYANRILTRITFRDTTRSAFPWDLAGSIIAVPASRSTMYGPGTYFLSNKAGGGGDVILYHVTGHIQDDPELNRYTIDITDYDVPASAYQPDTSERLDIGDCRIKSAYYQHGKIYFVFTKDDGHNYGGISFNRIRLSDLHVKSYFFHNNQNSDYSYPAIVNRLGNESYSRAVLVYLRSGKNTFPQIRMRMFNGSMEPLRTSKTIKSGASFRNDSRNNPGRWGDYIGIQRQYGTKKAWMTGHTATSDNRWQSHLISIDLP